MPIITKIGLSPFIIAFNTNSCNSQNLACLPNIYFNSLQISTFLNCFYYTCRTSYILLLFACCFLLYPIPDLLQVNPKYKNLCYILLTYQNCSCQLMTALPPSINSQVYIILAMQVLCLPCKSYRLSRFQSKSSSSYL